MNNDFKYQAKRRQSTVDLGSMVFGKIPPQNTELEKVVLGAIMIEKSAFERAFDIISSESFYREDNQRVFKAMTQLSQKGSQIDMMTVVEQLKENEELELVGGPYAVSKLTDSVTSSAHIETHCHYIQNSFLKRELIRLSGETIGNCYEDSVSVQDLIEDHEKGFTAITTKQATDDNGVELDSAIVEAIKRIEKLRQQESHITGIPSGFDDIDRITHGWQDTDLIILAARPAVGKTAFALNLARNAAKNEIKPVHVGFFSLEMSTGQLTERLLSSESEIWLDSIKTGNLDESQMKTLYKKGVEPLSKTRIHFDDTAALTIQHLRSKARKLKRKKKIGLLIIDYLQLMSGANDKNSNREQEISKISRDLKGLAKELKIPIIALSQLSREVEKRKEGAKMPQLSDLRESGAIEQDADMVMFLYRPEYYDITANEHGENNKGETHVKFAKHRNGDLGTVKLKALLHIQKFVPYMEDFYSSPQFPVKGNFRPVVIPGEDDTPF